MTIEYCNPHEKQCAEKSALLLFHPYQPMGDAIASPKIQSMEVQIQ